MNKQYVIEEDLLTFNVINKFPMVEETIKSNDIYGYSLNFYKKKQFLILTCPSSLIVIWEVNSKGEDPIMQNFDRFSYFVQILSFEKSS